MEVTEPGKARIRERWSRADGCWQCQPVHARPGCQAHLLSVTELCFPLISLLV